MTELAEAVRARYNEIIDSDSETDYGLVISSGYRNPKKNDRLDGSSETSKHQWGRAVDLVPGRLPPNTTTAEALEDIRRAAEQTHPGHYIYNSGRHVHIGEN